LRRPDEDERIACFDLFLEHPRAELEDDIVEFLTRLGPRVRRESEQNKKLLAYARSLPLPRRIALLRRVVLAVEHDWRSALNMVIPFTVSCEPAERALAAEVFLRFMERGEERPEVYEFVAWELFSNPDPKLRNPEKAIEIIRRALAKKPGDPSYRCALACFQKDREALEKIADEVGDASEQNSLAWKLVTRGRPTPSKVELAVLLAERSVAGAGSTTRPFALDTLAVVYAAKGTYTKALEAEEKALALMPRNNSEYADYAARVARFTALAHAQKDEYPAMPLQPPKLHSPAARDALLARLETEREHLIKREIVRLLKSCYANDPKVQKLP
jgi:tetratricopeptide (TPR) repeat protein